MNTKTDSREKILNTASRLFQLKGYNATGLNEILKESDAPKGSLYYYFPNGKEELATEATILASKAIEANIRDCLKKYSNPIEAMQFNIQHIIEILSKEGKLQDISISLLALETYLSSEIIREACKKAFVSLENIYVEKLIEGGLDVDTAQELGMVIQLMIEGAITMSVTKGNVTSLLHISKYIGVLLSPYF